MVKELLQKDQVEVARNVLGTGFSTPPSKFPIRSRLLKAGMCQLDLPALALTFFRHALKGSAMLMYQGDPVCDNAQGSWCDEEDARASLWMGKGCVCVRIAGGKDCNYNYGVN